MVLGPFEQRPPPLLVVCGVWAVIARQCWMFCWSKLPIECMGCAHYWTANSEDSQWCDIYFGATRSGSVQSGGGGARFLDFIFGGATPSGVRHLFRALHTIWTLRICGVHRVRPPHNGTRRRIVWAAPPPFICPHSRAVPCLGRPVAGRGPPPTRPPAAQPGRQQGADRRPGCIGLLCNSDAPPPPGEGRVGRWVSGWIQHWTPPEGFQLEARVWVSALTAGVWGECP